MLDERGDEALERSHDSGMDHDDALLFAFLVDAVEIEIVWLVEIELDGGHLERAADGVFGDEVDLGSIHGRFALTIDIAGHAAVGEQLSYLALGLLPYLLGPEVFLKLLGIMTRKTHLHVVEAECAIESIDDIPDGEDLGLDLALSGKHVRIVLSDGEHAREARELARLLVAVDHGGLGKAHRHVAVALLRARKDLRVVRAVHGLHGEEVLLARLDLEKL